MEGGDSDNDGGGSSVKLVAAHSIEDARFVADSTLAYEHGYFVHDPQGDSDLIFFRSCVCRTKSPPSVGEIITVCSATHHTLPGLSFQEDRLT